MRLQDRSCHDHNTTDVDLQHRNKSLQINLMHVKMKIAFLMRLPTCQATAPSFYTINMQHKTFSVKEFLAIMIVIATLGSQLPHIYNTHHFERAEHYKFAT